MNFIAVNQSVIDLLVAASALLPAADQFDVIGSQQQSQSASNIENKNKVLVYTQSDNFPENSGSPNGSVKSNPTIRILLECASKATYTDENNPNTITEAEAIVNSKMDLFFKQIYEIIMDAKNIDLGLAAGVVSGRFIQNYNKGEINKEASKVTLFASADLTYTTFETVAGDDGVVGTNIQNDFEINEDTEQKTGINVDPNT